MCLFRRNYRSLCCNDFNTIKMKTTLELINGRWCINGKLLKLVQLPKKIFFDAFVKSKRLSSALPSTERTFKQSPQKTKDNHNYQFKNKRDISAGELSLIEHINRLKQNG